MSGEHYQICGILLKINTESNIGGYMKFKDLPQKWKITVIILRILAVALPIALIANIRMTLGSLLMVMME